MDQVRRPLWFRVVCATVMACACVVAGLAADSGLVDALLFGIPGGVLLGLALADITWWDVLFYGPQS